MSGEFIKTADNETLTAARAKAYSDAARSPEGRAALRKSTPQEWLMRGAGGLGGGLLGWLVGKALSDRHKSLRVILGLMGAAAGSSGADYLMKHMPGVVGSDLSYSDISRLRSRLPELVSKVVDLEAEGAGSPNTPAQAARKRWAADPKWYGSWTAGLGGTGAAAGAAHGLWTGNIIGAGNISRKTLERMSRQAASSAANGGDAYKVLSDWLSGKAGTFEREAVRQGLDRGRLRSLRAKHRLEAVKDPNTGLSQLTISNTKRRRIGAGMANAALLGIAGTALGAGMDTITSSQYSPGAITAGVRAWSGL